MLKILEEVRNSELQILVLDITIKDETPYPYTLCLSEIIERWMRLCRAYAKCDGDHETLLRP
jgi:hypothetical protein